MALLALVSLWAMCNYPHRGMKAQIPSNLPRDVRQQTEGLYAECHDALKAASDFGKLGDQAVVAIPFLIKMLGDRSTTCRDRPIERGHIAARALASIGSPAVEPLIGAMQTENSAVKGHAIWALTSIGDPRGVPPLIIALNNHSDRVRGEAAYGLGQLKDERAVKALCEAVNDSHFGVRSAAIEALGSIGGSRAVDKLIELLKTERKRTALEKEWQGDPEAVRRSDAAAALGHTRDPRGVEPLIFALNDSHCYVRDQAAYALGQIGDRRAVEPLIALLAGVDREEGKLEDLTAEHVRGLKLAVVEALGDLGSPQAVDAVAGLLSFGLPEDNEQGFFSPCQLRQAAVRALAKIKDPRVVPLLITALHDPNELVWAVAAIELGKLGDPAGIGPLIQALKRKTAGNTTTTEDVAEALKKITGQNFGVAPLRWEWWWRENKTNFLAASAQG